MATAKKTVKKKPAAKKPVAKHKAAPKLVWRNLPDGGQYTGYKLGTIRRFKGKYSYSTAYNTAFNAKGLADAKKKIHAYTAKMTK